MKFLTLALLLAAAPCLAEERRGPYAFISSGFTSTEARNVGANNAQISAQGFSTLGEKEDGQSTPFSVGAGYKRGHFAIEAAYHDLGQVHYYSATFATLPAGTPTAHLSKSWEANALELAVVADYPVGPISVLVKAAALRVRGEYTRTVLTCSGACTPSTITSSGSTTVPSIALGIAWVAPGDIELRASYEWVRSKAGMFGSEGEDLSKIRLISLRLGHYF